MATHFRGKRNEVRALDAYIKLSRASGTLDGRLAANLARLGVTTGQLGVMEALMHLGPLSQRELGRKLLRSGGSRIDLRPMVTRVFPLAEAPQAMRYASQRGVLKVLLKP